MTIHGAPRFTKDIDLLVPDEAVEDALRVAEGCGYDLVAAPMVFDSGGPNERHVRRASKADGKNLLTLDLVLVEPGFASAVYAALVARGYQPLSRVADISFGAVSQHLAKLRDAGLVRVRKAGRRRIYRVERRAFGPLADALDRMWASRLDRLKSLAEAEARRRRRKG